MPEAKLEPRYVVFKIKDMENFFTAEDIELVDRLHDKLAFLREQEGKPPLDCVIVESDWPMFDQVVAGVLAESVRRDAKKEKENSDKLNTP